MVDVSGLLLEPAGYAELFEQRKARVRASQVRAVRATNSELLWLYWSVGRDILQRQDQAGWGSRVIDRLATDLRKESWTSAAVGGATSVTCGRWPSRGRKTSCSSPSRNCPGAT